MQRSLHGKLAHEIGRRIVRGELRPGSALPTEDRSMEEFHVSRTAYREAIKILTAKGLVDSRPRRGTRIRPRLEWNLLDPDLLDWISDFSFDPESSRAVLELRQAIEPQIAALAAIRRNHDDMTRIEEAFEQLGESGIDMQTCRERDAEFHYVLALASGNEMFIAVMGALRIALGRGLGTRHRGVGSARPTWLAEHDAVRRAILQGDPEAARDAVVWMLGDVVGRPRPHANPAAAPLAG